MAIRGRLASVSRALAAAVVAVLAFAFTADAVQTTTTPNASLIPYSLAAGTFTKNLTPPANVSVFVMGSNTSTNEEGTGFVTLLSIPHTDPSGGFVEWSGISSVTGGGIPSGELEHGYSPTVGTHIVELSYDGGVWIEVGTVSDTVRIHNYDSSLRSGSTTWIW
jgi:hypothetical protein